MSTLGSRIRQARENKNLTQGDLAKIIDVKSGAIISNWEKDINKPDTEKLLKLCAALEVSPGFLLSYGIEELSFKERALIQKYRALDERGKELIEALIDIEFKHAQSK